MQSVIWVRIGIFFIQKAKFWFAVKYYSNNSRLVIKYVSVNGHPTWGRDQNQISPNNIKLIEKKRCSINIMSNISLKLCLRHTRIKWSNLLKSWSSQISRFDRSSVDEEIWSTTFRDTYEYSVNSKYIFWIWFEMRQNLHWVRYLISKQ